MNPARFVRIGHAVRATFPVILFLGLSLAIGCGPSHHNATFSPTETVAEAIPVTVAEVVERPTQRMVHVVGTFFGFDEITITPKAEGEILRVYRDVGDVVRPGDPLLDLDPTDYRLAVEESRRALELELSRLGLTEPPDETFDIAGVPMVEQSRHQRELAASNLKRARSLFESRTLPSDKLEEAETQFKVAEAQGRHAELEAKSVLAAIRHRQAALALAEQRLRDTRVIVPRPSLSELLPELPVEYVVASRLVSEGELVRAFPSSPVMKLVMNNPLKLRTIVPERHVGEVLPGQVVLLRVEAQPERVFHGKITRISPTIDPTNRTFAIEVVVMNPKRELKPGGYANVAILTRVDPNARMVPTEAIDAFAGVVKVYRLRGEVVEAVPVTTGVEEEGWIEIRSGLEVGDRVVTSGHKRLSPGSVVRVRSATAENPTANEAKTMDPAKVGSVDAVPAKRVIGR